MICLIKEGVVHFHYKFYYTYQKGGWLMVGNVTVINDADAENKVFEIVKREGIENLHLVSNGAYTATYGFLRKLRNTMGYQFEEMRISCTKKWHGRKVCNNTAE